jgi:4-amino-4-deoxy-L-arabinose transferase-like glycosyltransferase
VRTRERPEDPQAAGEPAVASLAMDAEPRWWRPAVLVVIGVAVAVRVVFALQVAPDLPPPGDAVVYRTMASSLARGDGLLLEAPGTDVLEPTAEHPPVFPMVLAALDLVGLESPRAQGVSLALLTGAAVGLVALLGRRFGGPAVGVVAAGIAAVHPMWFQSAGVVMSESVHLALVPAVLLAAFRVQEAPGWRPVAVLGALIGVAALNRPESLGFVVAVGVPALVLSDRDRGQTVRGLAVLGGVVLLVVAPWLVRNDRQVGGVTMATNSGKTLLGSNCDGAFEGPGLGGFDYECQFGAAAYLVQVGPPEGGTWDGRRFDDVLGEAGRDFIREHGSEVPRVVGARIARMWGVAFAADQLAFDVSEGRHRPSQRAGQWLHLVLLPFVAAGAVLGFRRRQSARTILLLGIPVLVTLATAVVYGGTRMRSGAEPALAVLAAYGLVAAVEAVRGRSSRFPPSGTPAGSLGAQ